MKAQKKQLNCNAKEISTTKGSIKNSATIKLERRRRIEDIFTERLIREESAELVDLF